MQKKYYLRSGALASTLLCLLLVACGPSPEEQAATSAAMTAAAATDTPTPTPTPTNTPTPTPIPYDLTVLAKGEEDAPIVGANIVLAEAGEDSSSQITDEIGQASWFDLPGETVSLSINAQGYMPQDISEMIDRGPNDLTVSLERDPYGMLPSEACLPGEQLVYIEDFQDDIAQDWNEIEYAAQGWSLIPHPDTPDDTVAGHTGDQTAGAFLEGSDLDNAVWRVWLMATGRGEFFLNFDWAETTFEGGDWSAYQLHYNPDNFTHALYRYVAPNDHRAPSNRYQPLEENIWHKYVVGADPKKLDTGGLWS